MPLKPGDLWYYRTKQPVIANIAYPKPVKVHLISFNHLNLISEQYIMLFDRDKIPNDGAFPLVEFTAPPQRMVSYTPAFGGRKFNNGLVVALSATPITLQKVTVPEITYQIEGVIA